MEKLQLDAERLFRVFKTLQRGDGDLSECLAPDLKHTTEVLGHLIAMQSIAPGFLDQIFDVWMPHFIGQTNKANLSATAQRKADAAGFGDEWRAVVDAGNHPKQKDYLEKMIELHMKANNATQAEAIRAMAKQTGRDEDSVRRTVTRSKGRKK